MRIPAAAIAFVFLGAAISAAAQAAPSEQFTAYGAGTQSCGTWLADHESLRTHAAPENLLRHQVELSWVLGYLSASDAFTKGLGVVHLRQTDANAVSAWLDKYCREHPLKALAEASGDLITELAKPE